MKNKKWLKIAIIVIVGFFVLGFAKDFLIKTAITVGAKQVTGAAVKIDHFAFRVFSQKIHIKGFKMYNPKGFPKETLVDIPEIRVDFDLPALASGKLHLPVVILDLKKMVIIRNADGQLNVDALKIAQKPSEAPKEETKKKEKASKPMAMQIDLVKLNLGQVIVKDFTNGDPPSVLAYDIGIKDKEYKNIGSAQEFATLVMLQAMGPAALKGAKLYAAGAILGAGFLPVGVAGVLMGDAGSSEIYNVDLAKAFKIASETITSRGEINEKDEVKGFIKAKIDGADITVILTSPQKRQTEVKIAAKKMMLPKPEIANGLLYQISEKLK